jgi:hypothetical protein
MRGATVLRAESLASDIREPGLAYFLEMAER